MTISEHVVGLFGPTTRTRINFTVGLLVAFALILIHLNVPDLGDPFGVSVPREMWFQHRLQWDAVIGCGTELCR